MQNLRRRLFLALVAVTAIALAAGLARRLTDSRELEQAAAISTQARLAFEAQGAWLEERERRVAETVWAREILAQACGRTFEDFWDALNAATNKWPVIAGFPVGEVVLGRWTSPRHLPHDIEITESAGPGERLSSAAWPGWLRQFERDGWRLMQTEFRHNRFDTDAAGQPRQSTFYFSAHLTNALQAWRAEVVGDLVVDWLSAPTNQQPARVRGVDASRLTLKTRRGEPPFQLVLNEEVQPPERRFPIDPVIVYDLDGDGFSEIALPAVNLLYRRRGPDRYESEPLCEEPPGPIFTALVADFDNDSTLDLLCVNAEGMILFRGTPEGRFPQPPLVVWTADHPLKNPMAMTCGDIDGDGDLDVFFGQYKVPTLGQVLKPFYYDANDGYPAYLLLNDGQGRFIDATVQAGLEAKRWRRTYTASLVDLDNDLDLDLLVVNDFAGAEVFRNDGQGRFTEVTASWLGDAKGFGMSHTFADFNADGLLDFLMIGMPSATVDRLEHLGLTRPGSNEDWSMRPRMASGNRLFLAKPEGGFVQAPESAGISRSGWSWGASAADFDNDGWPDVYIANGHQSTRSVREYEPEFWLHDLYVEEDVNESAAGAYFLRKHAQRLEEGWSYGGYEKNRLCLSQSGRGFLEVAHLFGLALEEDCRNVVAEDFDGDGGMDILVTTYDIWPRDRQTLRLYRNRLADRGAWIGFRPGAGCIGVAVRVKAGTRRWVQPFVTGYSFRSQQPAVAHFGLGPAGLVDQVELTGACGVSEQIQAPAPGRYHPLAGDPGRNPSKGLPGRETR